MENALFLDPPFVPVVCFRKHPLQRTRRGPFLRLVQISLGVRNGKTPLAIVCLSMLLIIGYLEILPETRRLRIDLYPNPRPRQHHQRMVHAQLVARQGLGPQVL